MVSTINGDANVPFYKELADLTLYVIDVSADLSIMNRDARHMRGHGPIVFSNLKSGEGVTEIISFIEDKGGLSQLKQAG